MGIFNTINQKSGIIATVIVVAVGLFIIQDLLGPARFFSRDNNVGEIAGHDISYQEYNEALESVKANYAQRSGRNPSESEMPDVHNQVWNMMIQQYAYADEYKKLGLTVTEEEVEEMVSGTNLHEGILKEPRFQDSLTGKFDRKKYEAFKSTPNGQQAIDAFKQTLIEPRLQMKYYNLFQNSLYVTKEEARRDYKNQNSKAEVKYLYVPFYSIQDDSVKVSDDEISAYIEKHKKQYEMEDRRSLEYVAFPIGASGKDSADVLDELKTLAKDFATTDDDSLFSVSNSDQPTAPSEVIIGNLPEFLKEKANTLKKGDIFGPITENGRLKLYKVMDVTENPKDTIYSASAKHILFMTRGKSDSQKDSIKKKAEDVLKQIQKGADFDEMVTKYSEDPGSVARGGLYKWFPSGQMDKGFEKPIFDAKAPGLLPKLAETVHGYHIIKVVDTKTNKKVKLAVIDKTVSPTEGTNKAYQKATTFAGAVKDTASFRAVAKKDSLVIQKANNFKGNDVYIGNLMNPREIVKWAFDAKEGTVSTVFTMDDKYVVAILTRKRSKGLAEPDDVREDVTAKLRAEKKADKIIEALNKVKGKGDFSQVAQAYGPTAMTGTALDVTFGSGNMQGVGSDPIIVGTVFGLKPKMRTNPIKGDNGVAILELVKITEAADVADYSSQKNTLLQQKKNALYGDMDKAIRDNAEIEDNRVKFY